MSKLLKRMLSTRVKWKAVSISDDHDYHKGDLDSKISNTTNQEFFM
ncbi:MAG: hypothetical protein Q8761_03125 [Sweet potato little leaf phytoplasma]|nr:hypothetical protein [Sweet potato little leaf phytoplasma]